MKTMVKVIVLVAATFFLLIPPAFASSAPKGVNEIIEVMGDFEKSFSDYQWFETAMAVAQIRKELQQVYADSQLNDASLSDAANNLMRSVVKKNKEETAKNYALFQKEFSIFRNQFNNDVPQMLSMVEE